MSTPNRITLVLTELQARRLLIHLENEHNNNDATDNCHRSWMAAICRKLAVEMDAVLFLR